ncbi:MAG TPA: hypothetical protein VNK49_07405 [Anaerolineales bacterium]|nr:hypothetical protein [Anaerolineales bacterium]
MAIQFAHLGSKSQKQSDFDTSYREWEIQRAVIGTKLQAYFPETTIPEEWTRFSDVITQFYALEGVGQDERLKLATAIAEELGTLSRSAHQDNLDWGVLRNEILKRKSELIQKVLRAKITVLR